MRKNKRWLALLLAGSMLFSANAGLVYASELPGTVTEDPAAVSERVSAETPEKEQNDQPEITESSDRTPEISEGTADIIEEGTEDEGKASEDQGAATGEEQQEIPDEISKEQGASTAVEEDLQNPASEDAETTEQIEENALENQTAGNISWSVSNGTLTISGSGDMPNYGWVWTDSFNGQGYGETPWQGEISKITKIVVSSGITKIGDYAFAGCSNATSASIADTVKDLGNSMFLNCRKLEQVTLPKGIRSIPKAAFYECSSLKDIVIPDGVTLIEDLAFAECSKMVSASLPDSVTSIGDQAFRNCKSLREMKVPKNITTLPSYVFMNCSGMQSVSIPVAVKTIARGAFYMCDALQTVSYAGSTYQWGGISIVADDNSGLFNVTYLTTTSCAHVLRKKVVKVTCEKDGYTTHTCEKCGYSYKSDIEYASWHDLVYKKQNNGKHLVSCSKGDYSAEENCYDGDGDGFCDCCKQKMEPIRWTCQNQVLTITGKGEIEDYWGGDAPWRSADFKEVVIGTGITRIGVRAFANNKKLEKVTLPDTVTSIGELAFESSGLKSVSLPKNLTVIEDGAFSGCESLTNVVFAGAVTGTTGNALDSQGSASANGTLKIGRNAFSSCIVLKEISLPEGTTTIGDNAFNNCRALEQITLPNTITEMGAYQFYGCSSLQSVRIPIRITSIKEYTFGGCSALAELTIPAGVTSIEDGAFISCDALENVNYLGNQDMWDNISIAGSNNTQLKDAALTTGNCAHSYTTSVVAPGCQTAGYTLHFCSLCGYSYRDNETAAGTHQLSYEQVSTGRHRVYCSKCDYEEVEICTDKNMDGICDVCKSKMASLEAGGLYDDVLELYGWRYEAIKYTKEHGIMNGISGTHNFAPDEPLTRAMFATIIYRMEGSPKASYSTKFPDVPDGNYFSVPIMWANKAGIINGHSNTGLFGTHENITREDMVVIMYRYCRVKGLASGGRADLGRFPDADQISGYAKEAVQWAVANGIINGRSNTGMLDPKGNASRVETAAIIQRFMTKIK